MENNKKHNADTTNKQSAEDCHNNTSNNASNNTNNKNKNK